MPLNARQQRFVAEYAIDLNATQAAIRAGYSETRAAVTGHELLKNPAIADAVSVTHRKISEIVSTQVEEAVASATWIVSKAVEVVNLGLAASPVRDREGNAIMVETQDGEKVPAGWDAFNLAAANGALTLLAKRYPAVFSPESGSGGGDQHLHLHGLDDEQLRMIASAISRPT